MKRKIFTYLSAFILFTLMLFKVSSFHIYTHQDGTDTIENCETCYFSFQNQKIDFRVVSVLILAPIVLILVNNKIIKETPILRPSQKLLYSHFGRPPPKLR
ncbi:hypothetical protein [Maribacter sp. 4G9]|uniref:hypothetical protein n=1 Tax=Maribacter sp. 4G9 TaxID=1889777 RepID=UPI000C15B0B1|nr:hypothetical protein [Maribacter sp. 4G9]PIB38086.1 hypothetical protein BFP75_17925 [Maribacter sp. 4G9]